jgi:hypothetical protein
MRITLITGDSPRHQYLFQQLKELDIEIQWFIERRKAPDKVMNTGNKQIDYFTKLHFKDWRESEISYFGISDKKLIRKYQGEYVSSACITKGDLGNKIISWNSDIILSYGCSKIGSKVLDLPKSKKINIHGGLSPWYRGTITNFWPTYLLEPQFTGMTLHETTNEIDGGGIIFQTGIKVDSSLGINQNSCVAALDFISNFTKIIGSDCNKIIEVEGLKQVSSGRIWTNQMWTPHHLGFVYGYMDNKINKYCYDYNLLTRMPKLINCLTI